jgi:hypothetical protein
MASNMLSEDGQIALVLVIDSAKKHIRMIGNPCYKNDTGVSILYTHSIAARKKYKPSQNNL